MRLVVDEQDEIVPLREKRDLTKQQQTVLVTSHKMKELTMNLLASGFNGHEQLTPTENEELAKDVLTFKRVATGDDIKVLFAGWSCTVCKCIFSS